MRRGVLVVCVLLVAAVSGLVFAGIGLPIAVSVGAGLAVVVAVTIIFGVRTEVVAFIAVCGLVFTVTWNGIRIGGGALGDAFMVAAFLAVLAHVIADHRTIPIPGWLFVAGIGCFLAGLLTMIFPPSTHLAQKSIITETNFLLQDGVRGIIPGRSDLLVLIEFELSLVLIPVLIATMATTRRRCSQLIDLWTAGAVVNAAVGVADYAGITHLAPIALAANRSAGLTVQSNYLGLTCVLAIPTAILWLGRSRRATLAGHVAVPTLLGGVYASGSRAGTVAALMAVAATFVLVPRLRPSLAVLIPVTGMVLLGVLMFTRVGKEILSQVRIGSSNSTSLSDAQRSTAADVAWTQIGARPFAGVGFAVIADAHDIYLELLAAGGVLALVSFLTFCGGIVAAAWRSVTSTQGDAAIALSVAFIVWLINGVFDNQVADKYLYVVPGLLLAVSRAAAAHAAESRSDELAPAPALPAAARVETRRPDPIPAGA